MFDEQGYGMASAGQSLFERTHKAQVIEAAQTLGASLGVALEVSGAAEPGLSLERQGDRAWPTCRHPWSLMYVTAHGRALACCIAPFSVRGYSNYTLADATQQELREIWGSPPTGIPAWPRIPTHRRHPAGAMGPLEPVSRVIPARNEVTIARRAYRAPCQDGRDPSILDRLD